MQIGSIKGIFPEIPGIKETEKSNDTGFGDMLSSLVKNVNQDQADAVKATRDFADGKNVDLSEVMITGEKAKTSLQLLMEIRNKAVDMYNQLTRIQF
jgi:flagellar hook-basal body complex protein FliE